MPVQRATAKNSARGSAPAGGAPGGRLADGRHVLEPARLSGEVRQPRAAGRAVRLRALVSASAPRRACRALRARPGEQSRHHRRHGRLCRVEQLGPLVLHPVALFRPEPTGSGKGRRTYRR
ncbi:hypothetical protein ABZ663_18055 [Streptomyces albidoflavus]|uniref:hypothetical protein n=1 Tax=Streptomyces albidoflavus TaxID=1886 RepID=UPI0033F85819